MLLTAIEEKMLFPLILNCGCDLGRWGGVGGRWGGWVVCIGLHQVVDPVLSGVAGRSHRHPPSHSQRSAHYLVLPSTGTSKTLQLGLNGRHLVMAS